MGSGEALLIHDGARLAARAARQRASEAESLNDAGTIDPVLVSEGRMVATILAEQKEECVLAYPVNDPILGDLCRFVLVELFHQIAGLAVGRNDLDGKVSRAVKPVRRDPIGVFC